ncbi:MAG: AMP-binding protein [Myxococcales bacterium]|nr:AMP-binding protein [Myxococcales bacterium]
MSATASYAHGTSQVALIGETIGERLRRTVEQFPEQEALVVRSQGYRATYRAMWDAVTHMARGLLAMEIQRGDRVGVWSPNRFEWVVLQYATARIGAVLVNINPAYKPSELGYVLRQAGVSVLAMSRGFRHNDYVAMLAEVRDRCPSVRATVVFEDDWAGLVARGAGVTEAQLAEREATLQFDDAINIQYTSGTTGFPKGATLSHHNVLNNGYFIAQTLGYRAQDRVCVPVPFYHCFGMVIGNLACMTTGACVVVPGEAFDALLVLEAVAAERCTSLYGVPMMFIAELDHPSFASHDLSSLRTGVMAGASCPIEVMRDVQARMGMREVTICYGMTETSPVSTQSATDDPLDKRVTTVGRVHPHVEIKIIDPATGQIVPRGSGGELCTRGYSVMLGYWNDEAATRLAIDAGGWMHTGDLATMDTEGYVNIVGRIKDMIVRGGEKIYPRELEEFLHTHPAIAEAQVVGVPSVKYGEEVMAWVRPRTGAAVTPAELTAFCTGQIATFKIPRHWKITDEFPMTVTGKIQKFRMREIAIVELGLTDAAVIRTA